MGEEISATAQARELAQQIAQEKAKKKKDLLKKVGGGVFLCISIALFIIRMPKSRQVAAHADKPRTDAHADTPRAAPSASAAASSKAPVAAPMGPVVTLSSPAPEKPAAKVSSVDWADSCRNEIGILCHSVPERRLRRCLGQYDDVLLKDCRDALAEIEGDHGDRNRLSE